jgi:hypothetical protein
MWSASWRERTMLGEIAGAFAIVVTRAAASLFSAHHARKAMTTILYERSGVPGTVVSDGRPLPPGFLSAYPGYRSTMLLDRLRATEYSYLDASGHVYLDYTGAGLPAQAQLSAHAERIRGGCFGNPHSESPASAAGIATVTLPDRPAGLPVMCRAGGAAPEEHVRASGGERPGRDDLCGGYRAGSW